MASQNVKMEVSPPPTMETTTNEILSILLQEIKTLNSRLDKLVIKVECIEQSVYYIEHNVG